MSDAYHEQHKRRLSWMPWLYRRLKAKARDWAHPWQRDVQTDLRHMEHVHMGEHVFIAPDAQLFAEPHRDIHLGHHVAIGAHAYLHGPLTLGDHVTINPRCWLESGAGGLHIGDHTRIATGVYIVAFNHGMAPNRLIREQPTTSKGIHIGADVWIGAGAGITDGVTIGDHAVVAMGAVVTRDVPPWTLVAGVPARPIGDRRDKAPA